MYATLLLDVPKESLRGVVERGEAKRTPHGFTITSSGGNHQAFSATNLGGHEGAKIVYAYTPTAVDLSIFKLTL
jgi:hypothetical protein